MPGSTTTRSSRNCYLSLVPMSVRQQLKLVRQLETSDESGGNPSIKETVLQRPRSRSCNGRGETPLHKAAIKGDEELVVKLLEEGADPNVSDFAGWTPLHEACNHGWYGVALALIKAGASVNATGFDNDTPLHDAAINGHSKLVRLLVEQGADVHFRNKGGKTPCDVAAPGLMPHLLPCTSVEESETSKKFDVNLRATAQDVDSAAISDKRRPLPRTKVGKGSKLTIGLNQIKKKDEKLKTESNEFDIISRVQNLNTMEEKSSKEDVYEFKSSKEATPVRGNSISPDVDKNSSEVKNEKVEGYSGAETDSVATKRTISEVGDNDEVEDDSKKRKRKEKEGDGKDMSNSSKSPATISRTPTNRNSNANSEKGGKVLVNKNSGQNSVKAGSNSLGANGNNADRKSPSSPKPFTTGPNTSNSLGNNNKAETEQDDGKANSDGEKVDQGPKVPPLKIVIPPQTANEPEQGNRNGKNSASRHHHHHHHQALPYVVTSNNETEKEGLRSGSTSPTDSFKSDEKKDPAIGMLSAEDQKNSLHHQRVLRSSHRSGPGGANENRTQDTSSSSNATNNGNSNVSAPPTDNPSPQAQSRTSPLPQNESSTATPGVSAAGDNSSSSSNSSNTRSNSAPPSKNNQGPSNPTPTVVSEDKTPDSNAESNQVPSQPAASASVPVELHPRKRKLKHNKEIKESPPPQVTSERCESATTSTDVHPHEQPVKNCYQLFLDIRKQIERRRKGLFPVQPKPPQGFKDYLMNRCTYVLAGNASTRQIPSSPLPQNISTPMKDLFAEQEKERHRLRLQHVIEKEKLVLSVEQEILRVHGRAARALANQSLPFSACTILKDEEVYNLITPEQEEKDRNARSRYNGRLFLSWLQDVDDKWEKIKEAMLLRHHNEAESLHAVQKMDWEWKMKELGFCEYKSKPVILDNHVPMVHLSASSVDSELQEVNTSLVKPRLKRPENMAKLGTMGGGPLIGRGLKTRLKEEIKQQMNGIID